MIGDGIYSGACRIVCEETNAAAAVLIVLGGNRGTGCAFNVRDKKLLLELPEILRKTADSIQRAVIEDYQNAR
jgi:hypothetical protein